MVSHCLNIVPSSKIPTTPITLPPTIYIPPTFKSPIIVPISIVSTIPSTRYENIPNHPTIVVIPTTYLPTWAPSTIVVPVPSTVITHRPLPSIPVPTINLIPTTIPT
jgi:hypothetical protein